MKIETEIYTIWKLLRTKCMISHFYNVMPSFTKIGIIINSCQLSVQLPIALSVHEFDRTIFAVMLYLKNQ